MTAFDVYSNCDEIRHSLAHDSNCNQTLNYLLSSKGTSVTDIMPENISSHDNLKGVPLHRVATIQPFTEFLADVGASVERGFRQAGLPYCALESIDNYVPSQRFWSFLVNMAYSQGIEDLGFLVGRRFGKSVPDPHMASLLRSAPTMYRGLLKASDLVSRIVTNCRFGFHHPPGCGYSLYFHRPSCDANNPAVEQIGWYGILTLVDMVRVYTGPQWHPTEIGIMTDRLPGLLIREEFPNTRIRRLQPYSYVLLENPLLSLPPLIDKDTCLDSSPVHYEPLRDDLAGRLEQVMLSYSQESVINLEFVAGVCNTSKRTLQRKLTEVGTSYSELRDHALFNVASGMLKNPDIRITEIAQLLGYKDMSHFSRAFRRITGSTPSTYRHQHKPV